MSDPHDLDYLRFMVRRKIISVATILRERNDKTKRQNSRKIYELLVKNRVYLQVIE